MKVKFEVLRDDFDDVRGYKLGDYYLLKHYTWGNTYEWIINKTGKNSYFEHEFWKLYESKDIELADSCRAGKARLVELAEVQ